MNHLTAYVFGSVVPILMAFVLVRAGQTALKSGKILGNAFFFRHKTYDRNEDPAGFWFFFAKAALVGIAFVALFEGIVVASVLRLP
jgi:hypothetical protein